MIKTLAETIFWLADERMKLEKFQNRNSAIHSVVMDLAQLLMIEMAKGKEMRDDCVS